MFKFPIQIIFGQNFAAILCYLKLGVIFRSKKGKTFIPLKMFVHFSPDSFIFYLAIVPWNRSFNEKTKRNRSWTILKRSFLKNDRFSFLWTIPVVLTSFFVWTTLSLTNIFVCCQKILFVLKHFVDLWNQML